MRGKIIVKIDSTTSMNAQLEGVKKIFKAKNCLLVPVLSRGNSAGFLFAGNDSENFEFKIDDIELIKVLCKQLGIAIENAVLLKKAKELIVKDELTDLYNEKYIRGRLDEEIERSVLYQRPCSLLLFNIDNFKKFRDSHGEMATEDTLKKVATIIKESSTGVAKAARLGGDEFAIVLSEMNKKQSTKLADDIRKKIEALGAKLAGKEEGPLTISGSVSENPIDGTSAEELFDKARRAMKTAKLEGKNRICN